MRCCGSGDAGLNLQVVSPHGPSTISRSSEVLSCASGQSIVEFDCQSADIGRERRIRRTDLAEFGVRTEGDRCTAELEWFVRWA